MARWVLVAGSDAAVRWERVCERNRGESGTFSFVVTREMFEAMEERWELPGVEERGFYVRSVGESKP
ncbi:MAG: hypothetical protein WBY53_03100 [Acidobacteriaceae bacterium]